MQTALEHEPELRRLNLADGKFAFSGRISDRNAQGRAQKRLLSICRTLNAQLEEEPISLGIGDDVLSINQWETLLVDLEAGSIVVRFTLIGVFTLQAYGAIADYPSFKEAVPILAEDIRSVIAWVLSQEDNDAPLRTPDPLKVDLFFKDEDELIASIQNSN